MGRTVRKLLNSVALRFAVVEMCIRRAIPKWFLQGMSELYYFSTELRRNCTVRSEQSSGSCTEIGDEECVVPLVPFSLLHVVVYKPRFTSKSTILVERTEALFEIR